MGVSDGIDDIIEQNYAAIISDIPFKDILIVSRGAHILTDKEVDRLYKCDCHEQAGCEYLKILKSRSDSDFFKFCDILKSSEVANVQNLGLILEKAANGKAQAHG